jgi:signal transduction histidine kinase
LASGEPSTDDEQLTAKDGSVHLVTTTRTPLCDDTGRTSHLVISIQHIARLRGARDSQLSGAASRRPEERTSAARAAHEEQASKERLIILGQLSSSLAHQIRNPLCAISNALALLRRQVDVQKEAVAKQALGIAQEEVWVANRIISELLEYSRMQTANRTEVPVHDIVQGALASEEVPEGVEVVHEVGDHSVQVDENQVRNAVAKLIRNACEAMAGVGTLTFSSRTDGNYVKLVIGDTGSGVRPETVGLVFEPLITSKPLGMGLGLTTARALVVNQGGTLECESELGKGAQFTLRLPAVSSVGATNAPEQR